MEWKQYLKSSRESGGHKTLPIATAAARSKNRVSAMDKIRRLRNHNTDGTKRLSSVSLPVFTRARLRHAVKYHHETFCRHRQYCIQRRASESDILLACLVLLVSKLKCREGLQRRFQGPRYRLYNDKRYSYDTVTVYAERRLWLALQSRALELEVSLSFLADLAIRLYLHRVLSRLVQRNLTAQDVMRAARISGAGLHDTVTAVGVDYLRKLLCGYSYQKKPGIRRYGHPPHGRLALFSLRLDYSFG